MWITRVSIDNPVFATMLMAAILVLGLFAYKDLGVAQFPDIDLPMVVITTDYPDASPESVEIDVTKKIEDAVNTISGINNLTSHSYQSQSVIMVEFDLSKDAKEVSQEVREKVDGVKADFHSEIKEPKISRFNPEDQPILSLTISSSSQDLRTLTTLANEVISKQLQNVRGVGQVNVVGGVERQINIQIDPNKMNALGVSVSQVQQAIAANNQLVPVGTISHVNQDTMVQIDGKILKPQAFKQIIVTRQGNAPVYLSALATVVDGQSAQDSMALNNGAQVLSIDILKVQDANTIEVADRLYKAVENIQSNLGDDVVIQAVRDSSRGVRNSINNIRETLIEGALLTVLVVFLFLHSWRSTVITGLALPISVIGTFVALQLFGFTLNVMTFMALSLAIGILIDDAIVVRENIMRHLHMGKSHRQASLDATQEIGLAVLATTTTIVAVFLPVAFMGGIIGRFFYQFGVTISVAVLISLLVSMSLDPMMSSVWYDPAVHNPIKKGPLGRFIKWQDTQLEHLRLFYTRCLRWALQHRLTVLTSVLIIFIASFGLVKFIGYEFIPPVDLSENLVKISTPPGSTLEYTQSKIAQVSSALREFPEVEYTFSTINTGSAIGKDSANVYVHLVPYNKRKNAPKEMSNLFRQRLASIPGITVMVGVPNSAGLLKSDLAVSIQGPDLTVLADKSRQLEAVMRSTSGLVDIDRSLKEDKPTLYIRLKPEIANDIGVTVDDISQSLRPFVAGATVSTWQANSDQSYDVVVRLPATSRQTLAQISDLYIATKQRSASGAVVMVPLSQVATVTRGVGASQIDRQSLSREVTVSANVYGVSVGDASATLQKILSTMDFPPGYRYQMGGASKDIGENLPYALSALFMAIIFIYFILASQFGSFLQPIAIMTALPLTLLGVFALLWLAGSTLNVFSTIGFIMLMGLVTKNAILLIDFTNHTRKQGVNMVDALIEAGSVRLQPILMTTLAMIFGMIPLALGLGEGGEQRSGMAHAVIGGLITSSLFTLVVVPIIYTYLDSFGERVKAHFRGPEDVSVG